MDTIDRSPLMPPTARAAMLAQPWVGALRMLRRRVQDTSRRTLAAIRRQPLPHEAVNDSGFGPSSVFPLNVPWGHDPVWMRAARERRSSLMWGVLASTAFATLLLAQAQPLDSSPWLASAYLALFALLFAWVSAGCFTAVMGYVALRHGDPHSLTARSVQHRKLNGSARTALVMPIRNEQIDTVFGGLRAICDSLASGEYPELFDIHLLSDTSDPDIRVAELASLAELRAQMMVVNPAMARRIHYRWRQRRVKRKAGNIADFCRRFGRSYRYMVILDADSVMSGDAITSLVKLMEAHPSAGIIQAAPHACGQTTLHARAQQFASRVTGRLFTQGMQYWQLGESHYWGHNAIIRVEPFMKHCALAPLPGSGGLAGEILSHDFVEAALMRRAGFHVWIVSDLSGSYEQSPPDLIEELTRDRRWCQGNLQNARLIAEPGLHPVHRVMLATGAMAYVSAPLWLVFVGLGLALSMTTGDSSAALGSSGLWDTGLLWTAMVAMLLAPRALGAAAVLALKEEKRFGGRLALFKSLLLETGLSVLQAPVRMLAHTSFVVSALTGWALEWKSPPREARQVPWDTAVRRFAPGALLAAGATAALAVYAPASLPIALPIALPLLLAAPLAVFTSRSDWGEALRKRGWLLTPEESWAPAVLRNAWAQARHAWPQPSWNDLFHDKNLFDSICRLAPRRETRGLRRSLRRSWVDAALERGIQALTADQRMHLLNEPLHLIPLRLLAHRRPGIEDAQLA